MTKRVCIRKKQLWLEAVRSVEICVVLMHFAHASKKAHFGVKSM